jgi:hypothetical protein
MKPIPAIVENDVARHAAAVDQALSRVREAEQHAEQADRRAQSAHEAVRARKLELGRALIAARRCFPRASRNAKGWTDFLAVRRMTLEQAQDAMKYAGYVDETLAGASPDDPANLPTLREAGLDPRPREAERPQLALVPDAEPDPEIEIDRDIWCTPPWLTEAIGEFDLDPCSNDRSTVPARMQLRLDFGQDGLVGADVVHADQRVFANPPYSDVQPWITAYKHTRFCFLLKLDTSTRWFAELYAATALILIPRRRVNFIPPPGVPPEKAVAQQFPHALFYAHAEDATDAIRALCWSWRVDH